MSKILAAYDRSRIPLYIQVASVIGQRIQAGQWAPGQKISTLEELEREFQVARVTVRQAIDVLREEGLVHARQGRGTFVSKTVQDRHWLNLETTWKSLIDSVRDNVPQLMTLDKSATPPDLHAGDGDPAPDYVSLRSVQYRDELPYSIVNLRLATKVFNKDPKAFMRSPALSHLASIRDIKIGDAHQTLVIGSADPETADLMKIPLGAPTVQCHCVVIDESNVAIYVADIVYRSECIKLHINLFGNVRPPAKIDHAVLRHANPAAKTKSPRRSA